MATKKSGKHKVTQPTVDWDHRTGELKAAPESREYNLHYADARPKGKQFGMRITVNAFHQLLKGAVRAQEGHKNPGIRYVEFSKASVLRVLSQPGCEYIRFYFVYPQKDKMSLVLEGVDQNLRALKYESHVMKLASGVQARAVDAEDPDYEEVGNGTTVSPPPATESTESPQALNARRASAKSSKAAGQASLVALLKAINTNGE